MMFLLQTANYKVQAMTTLVVIMLLMFLGTIAAAYSKEAKSSVQNSTPPSPWMKPRELSSFQALFQHSPFSLATAEESSPLSERYALTGIITLDGEEEIFVLDRNDQSRELVTKKPNKKSMSLVNIVKETDPNKLKATIRVNAETGVITSIEPSTNNPTTGPQRFTGPGAPNMGGNQPKNTFHPPNTPYYPGQTLPNAQHPPGMIPNANNPSNPSNRRVITRPPIPGQPIPPPNNFPQ